MKTNIQNRNYKNQNNTMIAVGSWKVVEPRQVVMLIADANYSIIHFSKTTFIIVS